MSEATSTIVIHPRGAAEEELVREARTHGLVIDHCPPLIDAYDKLRAYAKTPLLILLRGETGTGKEPFARARHAMACKNAPFVDINCAGLNENLIESELFGHEKGAFTSATSDHTGAFGQVSEGGMLFLDEIGDISDGVQSKLLRVLETKQIRRVGGKKNIDVSQGRFTAATNQPLETLVNLGEFRQALFARLEQCQIHLPPVRDRNERHMKELTVFLVQKMADVPHPASITTDAVDALLEFAYSENVRELRDLLTLSYWLAQRENPNETVIRAQHIKEAHASAHVKFSDPPNEVWDDHLEGKFLTARPEYREHKRIPMNHLDSRIVLNQPGQIDFNKLVEIFGARLVDELMARCDGNQSEVAKILGITRGSVRRYNKLRELLRSA